MGDCFVTKEVCEIRTENTNKKLNEIVDEIKAIVQLAKEDNNHHREIQSKLFEKINDINAQQLPSKLEALKEEHTTTRNIVYWIIALVLTSSIAFVFDYRKGGASEQRPEQTHSPSGTHS